MYKTGLVVYYKHITIAWEYDHSPAKFLRTLGLHVFCQTGVHKFISSSYRSHRMHFSMLVLPGSSLFSPSKRETLLKDIQTSCPRICSVDAIYIHLANCASKSAETELSNLPSPSRKSLDRLLDYGNDNKLPGTIEA